MNSPEDYELDAEFVEAWKRWSAQPPRQSPAEAAAAVTFRIRHRPTRHRLNWYLAAAAAVLLEKTDPQYPEEAKKGKIQGAVKLDVTIGADGRVVELKIAESPDQSLSKAAADAVRNWKFKPAVNSKGNPVKVKMTLTVNFKLQ